MTTTNRKYIHREGEPGVYKVTRGGVSMLCHIDDPLPVCDDKDPEMQEMHNIVCSKIQERNNLVRVNEQQRKSGISLKMLVF